MIKTPTWLTSRNFEQWYVDVDTELIYCRVVVRTNWSASNFSPINRWLYKDGVHMADILSLVQPGLGVHLVLFGSSVIEVPATHLSHQMRINHDLFIESTSDQEALFVQKTAIDRIKGYIDESFYVLDVSLSKYSVADMQNSSINRVLSEEVVLKETYQDIDSYFRTQFTRFRYWAFVRSVSLLHTTKRKWLYGGFVLLILLHSFLTLTSNRIISQNNVVNEKNTFNVEEMRRLTGLLNLRLNDQLVTPCIDSIAFKAYVLNVKFLKLDLNPIKGRINLNEEIRFKAHNELRIDVKSEKSERVHQLVKQLLTLDCVDSCEVLSTDFNNRDQVTARVQLRLSFDK